MRAVPKCPHVRSALSLQPTDTLYAFYDFLVCPSSFDFILFISMAESYRVQAGLRHLHVVFVPGPRQGFREGRDVLPINDVVFRFRNIILPACNLVPGTCAVSVLRSREEAKSLVDMARGQVFPPDYDLARPMEHYFFVYMAAAHASGQDVQPLVAPEEETAQVRAWLAPYQDRQIVTLTLREQNHTSTRNSNTDDWERLCAWLKEKGHVPVVLRDIERTAEPLAPGWGDPLVYPQAVWNLHHRLALYEQASLNLFVNNGPAALAYHSKKVRYLVFRMIAESDVANNGYMTRMAHFPGLDFPFANRFQKIIWSDDSFDIMARETEAMLAALKTQGPAEPQPAQAEVVPLRPRKPARSPDFLEKASGHASVAWGQRLLTMGLGDLNRYIRIAPLVPEFHLRRALLLIHDGDLNQALEALFDSLRLGNRSPQALALTQEFLSVVRARMWPTQQWVKMDQVLATVLELVSDQAVRDQATAMLDELSQRYRVEQDGARSFHTYRVIAKTDLSRRWAYAEVCFDRAVQAAQVGADKRAAYHLFNALESGDYSLEHLIQLEFFLTRLNCWRSTDNPWMIQSIIKAAVLAIWQETLHRTDRMATSLVNLLTRLSVFHQLCGLEAAEAVERLADRKFQKSLPGQLLLALLARVPISPGHPLRKIVVAGRDHLVRSRDPARPGAVLMDDGMRALSLAIHLHMAINDYRLPETINEVALVERVRTSPGSVDEATIRLLAMIRPIDFLDGAAAILQPQAASSLLLDRPALIAGALTEGELAECPFETWK